jgi:ribosomal RNA-processing protein 1
LNKVLAEAPADAQPAPIIRLLEPFITILCCSNSKQKYKQVQDNVFEPLFTSLGSSDKPDTEDEDDEPPRKRVRGDDANALVNVCRHSALDPHPQTSADPSAVRKALSQRLFEAASGERTRDTNRRRIYDFLKSVGWDVDQDEDNI